MDDHHRISPTAMLVADLRGRLGQACADQITTSLKRLGGDVKLITLDESVMDRVQLHIALRSAAINRGILTSGIYQVLGLGEGLAPHGLALTRIPKYRYVETDLPDMAATKEAVIGDVLNGEPRDNLLIRALNALETENVLRVARETLRPGQPVVINVEGVMPYLDHSEKRRLLIGVRRVLRMQGGGQALVSSVVTKEGMGSPQAMEKIGQFLDILYGLTGRDVLDLAFANRKQMYGMFEEVGLRADPIDNHGLLDLVPQSLVRRIDPEILQRSLDRTATYVLRLA